ncbi:MAG: hypothetical protein A2V70_06250 [Planctomycetes bacterium RBG_13_63_9]|nr:MAG: hypothetical protein A2V70_06250 [Planctomycetes bacterium RBG_13_63_9]
MMAYETLVHPESLDTGGLLSAFKKWRRQRAGEAKKLLTQAERSTNIGERTRLIGQIRTINLELADGRRTLERMEAL